MWNKAPHRNIELMKLVIAIYLGRGHWFVISSWRGGGGGGGMSSGGSSNFWIDLFRGLHALSAEWNLPLPARLLVHWTFLGLIKAWNIYVNTFGLFKSHLTTRCSNTANLPAVLNHSALNISFLHNISPVQHISDAKLYYLCGEETDHLWPHRNLQRHILLWGYKI